MPCSDDEFDNLPFWNIDVLPSTHLENDLEPSTINETLDLHFMDHWKEFMDQNNNCLAPQEVLHKLCDLVDV